MENYFVKKASDELLMASMEGFRDLGSGLFLQTGANLIEDYKNSDQDSSHINAKAIYLTTDDGQEPIEIGIDELVEIGINSLSWENDITEECYEVYENGISRGNLYTKADAKMLCSILCEDGNDITMKSIY